MFSLVLVFSREVENYQIDCKGSQLTENQYKILRIKFCCYENKSFNYNNIVIGEKRLLWQKKKKKSWIIPNIYNYHIKFSLLKKII